MDLVLVSITVISLVLAIVMGLIVFKLLRDERLRSEARVALLRAATQGSSSLDLFDREVAIGTVSEVAPTSTPGDLFFAPQAESPWRRRLAVAVALAATVGVVGYAVTRATPSPSQSAAAPLSPLELTHLQHVLDDEGLTITGTVSNPATGAATSNVVVTAHVLGADGNILATGRAPLDYVTLAPGDESNFLVKVPVRGAVHRYRVGFRGSDGSVIAHVDRRNGDPSVRDRSRTENASWAR